MNPQASAPFLLSSSVNIKQYFLDSVAHNPDGTIPVRFGVSVRVYDSRGVSDINSVMYSIYPPGSAYASVQANLPHSWDIPDSDISIFTGNVNFSVDSTAVGYYQIGVTASNLANIQSNSLISQVLVFKNLDLPYLTNLVAPDTVVIPSSGELPIQFSVKVHDPNGYNDIAQVFLQVLSPALSSRYMMFDDGDSLYLADPTEYPFPDGDKVARDSIFSTILYADPTNTPGPKVLLFQAQNRLGLYSDSLLHTIMFVR